MTPFSPEFLLAVACCRWPSSLHRDAAVAARSVSVDWERFGALVRRHRVEGLASHALSAAAVALPPQLKTSLAAAGSEIAQQNLLFAAQSMRIARLFEEAGIPFLFVKGITLDKLVYGTLALKRSRDIDMAVAPEALAEACELLAGAEYDRVVPGPEVGPEGFSGWVQHCKETAWKHRRTGILVELHNSLVDNPDLLRAVGVHSARQMVEIGPSLRLPTLGDPDLFAYLCVHGATHGWSRLKWLADVAAFLARFPPATIAGFYGAAVERGAGRPAAQALLLCAELFETDFPAPLAAELRADRSNRRLVALARRMLRGRAELDETVLGTVPIHLSHFLLGSGLSFKLAEAGRKLHNPHDRAALALPRALRFLYPILLLPRWLWRRIRAPAPL